MTWDRVSQALELDHLPDEVLGMTFVKCLPSPDRLLCFFTNAKEAPLLLVLVCKRWRRVALSTPRLWMHISIESKDTSNLRPGIHALRMFSERSSKLPLSLSFWNNDNIKAVCKTWAFRKAVAKYLHRCGTVTISTTRLVTLRWLVPLLTGAEQLHHLHIDIHTSDDSSLFLVDSDPRNSLVLPHEVTSRLGSLRIDDYGVTIIRVVAPISLCVTLRKIILSSPLPWSTLLRFIEHCPNIEELCIPIVINRNFPLKSPLTSPNLRRFSLDYGARMPFLQMGRDRGVVIHFPSLTELVLKRAIEPLIFRTIFGASPNVEFILVDGRLMPLTATAFEKLTTNLRLFPSLETLVIRDCLPRRVALLPMLAVSSALANHGQSSDVCPKLKRLFLGSTSAWDENVVTAVLGLVKSRCMLDLGANNDNPAHAHIHTLQELVILEEDRHEESCWEILTTHPDMIKCVENGLTLSMFQKRGFYCYQH